MHRAQKSNRPSVAGRAASIKTAISTIKAYRQSLGTLGARQDIVKSLDLAIIELERVQNSARPGASAMLMALPFEADPFKGKEPSRLTIEESRTLVEDEGLGRKALERIAIERFAVPKGSMRSYPTIGALREKLMTLIRNDFAHHTIANVSRGG